MKTKKTLLLFSALFPLFFSCAKYGRKPTPCFTVSKPSPIVNEAVTLDVSCSKNTKWAEFTVDGFSIGGGSGSADYTFTTTGDHTVVLTVYTAVSGTMSSRTGCSNCSGSGQRSSLTKTITVLAPPAPVAGSNSPLYFDETLNLTASQIPGATYLWTGPGNFTSTDEYPSIPHVTAAAAGVYSVTASTGSYTSAPGTVTVTILPVSAPCSPANNTCTFAGYGTSAFNLVQGTNSGGHYTIYASCSSAEITIAFKNGSVPADGLYTINTQQGGFVDLAPNEVTMDVNFSGGFCYFYVQGGKIYVTVIGGKPTAVFCDVQVSCNSTIFAGSAKITVP